MSVSVTSNQQRALKTAPNFTHASNNIQAFPPGAVLRCAGPLLIFIFSLNNLVFSMTRTFRHDTEPSPPSSSHQDISRVDYVDVIHA